MPKGRAPKIPVIVLYRRQGCYYAMVVRPADTTPFRARSHASGPYAALGDLRDRGYRFGNVLDECPAWARSRIPDGGTFVGFCWVQSFPT